MNYDGAYFPTYKPGVPPVLLVDTDDPERGEDYYQTEEVELPTSWQICERCSGEGHHTNPSIDGNGLTREDMDELGPDFLEDYMRGVYDIACHSCGGSGKVQAIDRDQCKPALLEAYDQAQDDEASYQAECEAERRAGC